MKANGELEKKTTEELDALLAEYTSGENWVGSEAVVLEILQILWEREDKGQLKFTPEVIQAWERYLQKVRRLYAQEDQ